MIIEITKRIVEMQRCCGTDETRKVLAYVHASKEQARFEATNGHIWSIIECPALSELPESLLINFEKNAGKVRGYTFLDTDTGIMQNSRGRQILLQVATEAKEGPYPDLQRVIPTKGYVYRTSLNASMLADLVKSINPTGAITLEFNSNPIRPVRVHHVDLPGNSGVSGGIMPLPLNKKIDKRTLGTINESE